MFLMNCLICYYRHSKSIGALKPFWRPLADDRTKAPSLDKDKDILRAIIPLIVDDSDLELTMLVCPYHINPII